MFPEILFFSESFFFLFFLRTRVIVPASDGDYEQWRRAFEDMLDAHLGREETQKRAALAKDIEPLYQKYVEYNQRKV